MVHGIDIAPDLGPNSTIKMASAAEPRNDNNQQGAVQ
jgi:hypothetical protein